MLESVVGVLKRRFNNLTTEETVALATELIHVMVEATPKEE